MASYDSTERLDLLAKLVDEARFEGVVIYDHDERLVHCNQAAAQMLGAARDVLRGQSLSALLRDHDRALVLTWSSRLGGVVEATLVRVDGTTLPVEVAGSTDAATQLGLAVVFIRDISKRKAAEQKLRELASELERANAELRRLATHDPLTSVLNRRGCEQVLTVELERARRQGAGLVALLVDCDDFKSINTSFGHVGGDGVLRGIAKRLGSALRRTDSLSRIGGDEFLVVLPMTRFAEAASVAERVRLSVSGKPFICSGARVNVTVSIAIANVPPHEVDSLEDVLALARDGLTRSKRSGKNAVNASLGSEHRNLLESLNHDGAFSALAHPIVRVHDGGIMGYEMLARGPKGPFHSPVDFFRVARENDVLAAVDLSCVRACLAAARALPAGTPIHLNVFPTTFMSVDFDEFVDELSQSTSGVCVELSERQFVGDQRELGGRAAKLREAGIKLAIDDVGAGRGTMDSVILLEPQVVKIDKSLVQGASSDAHKQRVLARVVRLVAALGSDVIAEGVEQPEDRSLLEELGVPSAQGYLWGKPRPAEDFARYPIGSA